MKKLTVRIICLVFTAAMLLLNSSCQFVEQNNGDTPHNTQTDTGISDTDTTDATDTTEPNKNPPPAVEATNTPQEAARQRLSKLPSTDLSLRSVIIATTNPEVICPSIDSDNEIIRIRKDIHRAAEEKFGTVIIQYVTDANTILTEAKNAYSTDMYYADLLSIPQNKLGVFHAEGILANMNSLPFADYTAEYYNQNINANAKFGSVQFGISGTANIELDKINCIYYNKTLLGACGVDNIYSVINEGKWTYDLLNELALTCAVQNQEVTPLGTTAATLDFIDTYASAQSIEFVSNIHSTPSIDYYETGEAEKIENIVTSLYNMIYKDKTLAKTKEDATKDLFTSDKLMFCFDNLTFIEKIPLTGIEWGILPIPKYSEEENYITPTSPDMQIFCVLANTPSYETSGLILEALNLAAHDYIDKTFKDTCIDYYLRDSGSVSMLNKIFDTVSCDFSHMFGPGITYVPDATYKVIQNAVTTRSTANYIYRNYHSAANRYLTAALAKYE